jgi:CDP-6-deoxy-D-xylo-4-hexulose-3-dehydrase
MTKQPAFEEVTFRQIGEMVNTDNVMKSTFMIGVFPGISKKEIEKIFWVFNEFFKSIETQK